MIFCWEIWIFFESCFFLHAFSAHCPHERPLKHLCLRIHQGEGGEVMWGSRRGGGRVEPSPCGVWKWDELGNTEKSEQNQWRSGEANGFFSLKNSKSRLLKMVLSKFGISGFPGGPHFQGLASISMQVLKKSTPGLISLINHSLFNKCRITGLPHPSIHPNKQTNKNLCYYGWTNYHDNQDSHFKRNFEGSTLWLQRTVRCIPRHPSPPTRIVSIVSKRWLDPQRYRKLMWKMCQSLSRDSPSRPITSQVLRYLGMAYGWNFWGLINSDSNEAHAKKGRFSVLVQDSLACYVECFQVLAYILGRLCPKSIFVHIKGPTKTKENSSPSFVPPKISNPHIQLIPKKPTNKTQILLFPPIFATKGGGGERELLGFYHGFSHGNNNPIHQPPRCQYHDDPWALKVRSRWGVAELPWNVAATSPPVVPAHHLDHSVAAYIKVWARKAQRQLRTSTPSKVGEKNSNSERSWHHLSNMKNHEIWTSSSWFSQPTPPNT